MAEECYNCGSTRVISRYKDGDTYFRCKNCKVIVENGVETRAPKKLKRDKI